MELGTAVAPITAEALAELMAKAINAPPRAVPHWIDQGLPSITTEPVPLYCPLLSAYWEHGHRLSNIPAMRRTLQAKGEQLSVSEKICWGWQESYLPARIPRKQDVALLVALMARVGIGADETFQAITVAMRFDHDLSTASK